MIVRSDLNPKVEKWKKELGLKGDVYIVDHFIESLESHRRLFPNSRAATIEEAEFERINAIKEQRQADIERMANQPTEEIR